MLKKEALFNFCDCIRFSDWMSTSSFKMELVQSWGMDHSGQWLSQVSKEKPPQELDFQGSF